METACTGKQKVSSASTESGGQVCFYPSKVKSSGCDCFHCKLFENCPWKLSRLTANCHLLNARLKKKSKKIKWGSTKGTKEKKQKQRQADRRPRQFIIFQSNNLRPARDRWGVATHGSTYLRCLVSELRLHWRLSEWTADRRVRKWATTRRRLVGFSGTFF